MGNSKIHATTAILLILTFQNTSTHRKSLNFVLQTEANNTVL